MLRCRRRPPGDLERSKGGLMGGMVPSEKRGDVSIVLCGQAGQGIQTVEFLLTRVLKLSGYNVFATKEYMSRIRGGMNSTEIRVSSGRVRAFVDRIDILVALDKGAGRHVGGRMSRETVVLAEKEVVSGDFEGTGQKFVDVPFTRVAGDIGNKIYSNVVAVGAIAGLFGVDLRQLTEYVGEFFSGKSGEVIENNIKAVEAGYRIGRDLSGPRGVKIEVDADPGVKDELLLNGAEAVGLGAIAGGCNFISAYPMSPSTGVLVFLARHGADFGILAEQAEDEIAAINMAVGAWYAGARAMVTTSGGGFALMTEGVSLAGMLESPVVIHLAQRPGPATGLPTRTEQGDLELALYGGHGEFPRIILAPGTVEEAFYLTQKAFNLADRYQVPVFVLTDEYLMDSYYNTGSVDASNVQVATYIAKSEKDYRRYEVTESGVSPRGIPGFGDGLVAVDSDEHDEAGHITEDLDLRVRMVDKRLRKLKSLRADVLRPELVGPEDYEKLVICWGSTYNAVREALSDAGRDDTAMLHYKQVYPLHSDTSGYLRRAKKTIIVEGNATGQLAKQIKLHTGVDVDEKVLKYSGLNFAVEELAETLGGLLKQG